MEGAEAIVEMINSLGDKGIQAFIVYMVVRVVQMFLVAGSLLLIASWAKNLITKGMDMP